MKITKTLKFTGYERETLVRLLEALDNFGFGCDNIKIDCGKCPFLGICRLIEGENMTEDIDRIEQEINKALYEEDSQED